MRTTNVRKHVRMTRKGKSVVRYHRRQIKRNRGAYPEDNMREELLSRFRSKRLEKDPFEGQPIKKSKFILAPESTLYKQKPYVQPKLTAMQRFNAWRNSTIEIPDIHLPKLPKIQRETKYVDFDTYVRKMRGEVKPFSFKERQEKWKMAMDNLKRRMPKLPQRTLKDSDFKEIPTPPELEDYVPFEKAMKEYQKKRAAPAKESEVPKVIKMEGEKSAKRVVPPKRKKDDTGIRLHKSGAGFTFK